MIVHVNANLKRIPNGLRPRIITLNPECIWNAIPRRVSDGLRPKLITLNPDCCWNAEWNEARRANYIACAARGF